MLELEHDFRVVDVYARLSPTADGRGSAETLERELHQAGVVRAVVFPGPREGSYLSANNGVARNTVERPLVAFARIDGARESGGGLSRLRNVRVSREEHHTAPGDIEQYAYDDRFHGFMLDPGRDGLPDAEVLAMLDDVSLPLLVEAGERFTPAEADPLLGREFPVVLAHFGGHPLNRDLMHRAIDRLDEFEHLYLDTSAVRYREPLERAIREHPDRVVFGSGAPDVHPGVAVMELLTLDVPADSMRKVFSRNAGRVVDALAP